MRRISLRGARSAFAVPFVLALVVVPGPLQARTAQEPATPHAVKAAARPAGSRTFTLRSCRFSDLAAALSTANATAAKDTIVLKAGCTYLVAGPVGDPEGRPVVRNPLRILGRGATLTRDPAGSPGGLLQVVGSAAPGGFSVDDVTFTGGRDSQGSAILVVPSFEQGLVAPAVTVTRSRFLDNSLVHSPDFDPGYVGGAISVQGLPGTPGNTVTLTNDVFTGNSTYDGPAGDPESWEQRAGGAVFIGWFVGPAEISGCTFTGNHTDDAPAGGTMGLGYSQGGAVFSAAPLTVADSTFTGNRTGAGGSGGAIWVQPWFAPGASASLTLKGDNTFEGNSSSVAGGAIAIQSQQTPGTLTVKGGTFADNSATERGGAISSAGVNVTIKGGARFEGNAVTEWQEWDGGGAVSAGGGGPSPESLLVRDSRFSGNHTATPYGGAIAGNTDTVTVERSSFTANAVDSDGVGGGIWIGTAASTVVSDSTFTLNSSGAGGGIGLEGGFDTRRSVTVTGSTFDRNSAGAIWAINGDTTVVNSTFAGNSGNAVMIWGGTANVVNGTLSGDTISLWTYGGWSSAGTLTNTILAGGGCNVSPGSTLADGGGNLAWGAGGCPGTFETGDPMLSPLADNTGWTWTMALRPGSAAIDDENVNAAACPAQDQRGVDRPQGDSCDVGAFEYVPSP